MEEERPRKEGSAFSSTRSAASLGEGLRLLRLAESLRLSADTIERIKNKIFGDAGRSVSRIEASQTQMAAEVSATPIGKESPTTPSQAIPSRFPQIERLDDAEVTRLAKAFAKPHVAPNESESKSHSKNIRSLDESLEAEILLRKKIEASQNWQAFKAEAWQLYERYPRPDTATRLTELALMYGTTADLEEVLVSLNRQSIDSYAEIPAASRVQILLKLWQAKRHDFIDRLFFRKDMQLKLLPIELWYCCWSMIDRGQGEQAFRWFKRHENAIRSMQKQYGPLLHKSETELSLALGSKALHSEDEALAIKLLESIPQSSPEFNSAIDLLLDVRVERDDKGFCAYGQKLSRELDWKARLGLLDSFLLRIQRVEHLAPKDRAALNQLLLDPLRWFPETPEATQLVSEILLQYAGLEKLLPNLLKTFHDRANLYGKAPMEHALWAPVLEHDFRNPMRTAYWRTVALLHDFAWSSGKDERKLWGARKLYEEAAAYEGQNKPLPYSWQQLHKGLTHWMHKSEKLDEATRNKMLLTAKLCGEARDVSEDDVTNYLTHVPQPSLDVLDILEILARDRQQWGLELFILARKAAILHVTNHDLGRIFEIGKTLQRSDLCWRTATLLHARQALSPELERHWLISGEKRREFPLLALNEAHLKRICQSFEGLDRRLVEAVLSVGPLIPELLAGLNPQLVPVKKGKALTKNEIEVQESLDKMGWIAASRKQFSPNPNGLWQAKPVFFSNLLDSKWSVLFVGLAQRLGINAWEWQLSLLNQQIETILPRMSRTSDSAPVGKVGRWLRTLNPGQRKAWYELAQLAKKIEDEKAQEVLGRFLAILTSSIHQDHLGALANLERMRAPLRLRWDLENWIVSDAYGEIRKSLATHSIARFPDEVYRLPALKKGATLPKPKL